MEAVKSLRAVCLTKVKNIDENSWHKFVKEQSSPTLDPENVYARNNSRANTLTTNKKSYAHSLDISNIEEKSEFVVESKQKSPLRISHHHFPTGFGDKLSHDASDMKIILATNKEASGSATPEVRYGKMSEEAAALAYEARFGPVFCYIIWITLNRRKQLLETLSKAAPKAKKSMSPTASIPKKFGIFFC